MNIFYTNGNPAIAAQEHCDKHVVKMILEYAQLLSTAHHVIDGDAARPDIYAITHKNHPSAVWVRQSVEHYGYVRDLMMALGKEYTHRYGKVHKTMREVAPALILPPHGMALNDGWTPPPQCMPDEHKRYVSKKDSRRARQATIRAYQDYIRKEKRHFAKWTNRSQPYWF